MSYASSLAGASICLPERPALESQSLYALGILMGGRFTSDLLKTGAERGFIESLFSVTLSPPLGVVLAAAGIEGEMAHGAHGEATPETDIIIRRELAAPGRNKIFINNQLATQSLLRELRPFLVDIHGQGDQQTLFSPETHLELLDAFTANAARLAEVGEAYRYWLGRKRDLDQLQRDEAERFQLVDILKFQINELESAQLAIGEDATLEEERRRLLNFEKLSGLSDESYRLIYEDNEAALTRVRQAMKRVAELAEYESSFADYREGLEAASAVLEDLAFSLRGFSDKLEFSPARLAEIEDRLVEISRLKRKYGGSIESSLEHLARSEDRLRQVEHSAERELQLRAELSSARVNVPRTGRQTPHRTNARGENI